MANLQFEEEQYELPAAVAQKPSWLSGLVIRTGLAQDEAGAQRVLLVALALIIVAIVAVNLFSGGSSAAPAPSVTGVPAV